MRRTLSLVILFASSSASLCAQPFEDRYPTGEEQIAMGVVGHLGGGLSLVGVGAVATFTDSPSVLIATALVLYPLGAAAASYGLGRAFETDGRFGSTLRGAYLGLSVGIAVGVPLGWLLLDDAETLEGAFGAIAVGSGLIVAGTLVGAIRGYNASIRPAVARDMNGRTIPALTLAVNF